MTGTTEATVMDDIAAGRYDGELVPLVAALLERAQEMDHNVRVGWRLSVDGDEWDHRTVTLGELAWVERLVGAPYLALDPHRQLSHAVALVAAHLHQMHGVPEGEAIVKADQLTAEDLAGVLAVDVTEG